MPALLMSSDNMQKHILFTLHNGACGLDNAFAKNCRSQMWSQLVSGPMLSLLSAV